MFKQTTRSCALALAALALPAAVHAQQRTVDARVPASAARAPAAASRDAARAWYGELQQIGTRLQAAHERALANDARLRSTQQALYNDIKRLMEDADPGLAPLASRVQAIEAEARRAREAGNRDRLRTLATEASQIQGRFLAVQSRVMSQTAIATRMRSYETQLHQRMLEAEPQLDRLLARSRELQTNLAQAARARQQQAAAGANRQ